MSLHSLIRSESRQSIALLQDSVSVLLHCLEIVNTDAVAGGHTLAWEVQEAVKCAACLRRVYEEVLFYLLVSLLLV